MFNNATECLAYHELPRPYTNSILWLTASKITVVLSGISTIMSFQLIYLHSSHFSTPTLQKYIIRILLMVPYYAILSTLAFWNLKYALYISIIRDVYEGFVVWNFLKLFLEYLGPTDSTRMYILSSKTPHMMPPPFCVLKFNPASMLFLSRCKFGVLQFVLVRLFTSITSLFLEYFKLLCHGNVSPQFGHVYMQTLNSLSMGMAMFSLVAYYFATRHDISKSSPVSQFMSIKFVIFLQFVLSLVVSFLVSKAIIKETDDYTIQQFTECLQNFITILNMAIASIWHQKCFSIQPFINVDDYFDFQKAIHKVFDLSDLWLDVKLSWNYLSGNLDFSYLDNDSTDLLLSSENNESIEFPISTEYEQEQMLVSDSQELQVLDTTQ
ncbi:organic solute transporter Ostalpha-domain-containing protein [Globomyces pollinis-pini]|nr:organic solute transporter Ostalpha-domain-containing protein [Globomyces pollinis-pini]